MTFEENTAVLLDNLSDGQWHTQQKIMRHSGKGFQKDARKIQQTLNSLVEADYLIAGNNKSYRFTPSRIHSWRHDRGIESRGEKDLTAPRFFGGIIEDDGWLLAPLRTHDLVHFRINGSLTLQDIQRRVGLQGLVRQDIDGLVRVSCLSGKQIYDSIKAWKLPASQSVTGVRLDTGVHRRELIDLPPAFISDLCAFYGSFAHTLLRRSMTSVKKHINDPDDIQQQIYLWIIDAIQRYDATTSIPFAAFLHSSLQRWVHDLNRKSYGRAIADSELKYSRAVSNFITKYDRKPTDLELAEVLGESPETVREKLLSISRVNNLRTPTSLAQEDYEIPVKADNDHERDFQADAEQTILSAAMTSAALDAESHPQVLAWLKTYDAAWGTEKVSALKKVNNDILLGTMRKRVKDALL